MTPKAIIKDNIVSDFCWMIVLARPRPPDDQGFFKGGSYVPRQTPVRGRCSFLGNSRVHYFRYSEGAGRSSVSDIVEQIAHLQIQNEHQREMLRFSTTHINIGDGPLQIRGGGQVAPCVIDDGTAYAQCTYATQEVLDVAGNIVHSQPAGVAFFHPQHNHWHQSGVARFEVRKGTLDGPLVNNGVKITFCLVDTDQTDLVTKGSNRFYFNCNAELQGISVGWGDNYHQSTPLQELEITGIPEAVYYLTHLADPENHWKESNESNNFAWVKFSLRRQGANPKITILETSGCLSYACGSPSNP